MIPGWRRQLRLATFVAWLEGAGMPDLVFGVGGTEPASADITVEICGGIARLIQVGNSLASLHGVPGFGWIQFWHDKLAWSAQYT
jgi:hypothetical protein